MATIQHGEIVLLQELKNPAASLPGTVRVTGTYGLFERFA
jgi:hypothetical protein